MPEESNEFYGLHEADIYGRLCRETHYPSPLLPEVDRMTATPKPLTAILLRRSLLLNRLEYEANDELFGRVLSDIGRLIAKSEEECKKASQHDDEELAEIVYDAEAEYIEELIGSAFLLMQTKIRRVTETVKKLEAALTAGGGANTPDFTDDGTIKALGRDFKHSGKSLVAIVWAFGNYYKHRDEWPSKVWSIVSTNACKHSVRTRETVQLAGVVQYGTGNMRAGFDFLDVNPYSDCIKLGEHVQKWVDTVYQVAKQAVQAAP